MLGDICRDETGKALFDAMEQLRRSLDALDARHQKDDDDDEDSDDDSDDIEDLDETPDLSSWADPNTLTDHYQRHGKGLNATSEADYVQQANQFYQRAQAEKLPSLYYPNDGALAIYEPETNTFGIYKPNGQTASFYKPPAGIEYYQDLVNTQLSRGGRIGNPLPESAGGSGRIGDGTAGPLGDPLNEIYNPFEPKE